MTLRVEGGIVREARFLAQTCGAAMALASIATERMAGLPEAEIFSWKPADLRSWVGTLPRAKHHAAELVCRAVHQALRGGSSR